MQYPTTSDLHYETADDSAAAFCGCALEPLITSHSIKASSPQRAGCDIIKALLLYCGNNSPVKHRTTYAKPLMTSQTPRKRGRKRDLYTRIANGISHSPHSISAAVFCASCRRRSSRTSASR